MFLPECQIFSIRYCLSSAKISIAENNLTSALNLYDKATNLERGKFITLSSSVYILTNCFRSRRFFGSFNSKIGISGSAFNGQSESLIGKALPDLDTINTAGATLNAVGSMR